MTTPAAGSIPAALSRVRYTPRMRRLALIGSLLCLFAPLASAAEIAVSPVGYDAGVRQMLAGAASVAHAEVSGAGESIVFAYSAARPLAALVFFHAQRDSLDIATALRGELPAAENGEAVFPLASSPAWRPGARTYLVYLVSDDPAGAEVRSATVTGGSSARLPLIGLSQLLAPEPFQPSLYHRLAGYRAFGLPLAPAVGVLTLIAVAVLAWRAPRSVLPLLACALLLYGLRFSLDLGRFTAAHVAKWTRDGTYATAGSASAITDAIRADAEARDATVLVCTSGTSYVPTLLSYLLYPLRVTTEPDPAAPPAYVVVSEAIGGDGAACAGGLRLERMSAFPDGSVLSRVR